MSAEDNSSAESADIGEALVAALGFEPTEGRKRRSGSNAANDDEPSVDDAFIVVPSDASESDVPTEAELKAAAQPSVTVNGNNGNGSSDDGGSSNGDGSSDGSERDEAIAEAKVGSKSDSGSVSDGAATSDIDQSMAEVDSAFEADSDSKNRSGSGGSSSGSSSSSDDVSADTGSDDDVASDQSKSRKSKRRRNRSSNSKSSNRSQGPAKMADKPSAAKVDDSDSSSSDDDETDSWDMSESSNGSASTDDAASGEPSSEVKAKVDEITAEAISSVAAKSDADLELDKAWEESQAEAKAEAAAAKSKSKSKSDSDRSSSGSKSSSGSESKSGSGSGSGSKSGSGSESGSKGKTSSSNVVSSKADPGAKVDDVVDGPMAAAASVTGDLDEAELVVNDQPPPPAAADAINVIQPAPDGTMPSTSGAAHSSSGSNVDELLAETVSDVPSSPPTAPPTMPAVAEAAPARADSIPTAPAADKVLPQNRLEVRDDELAAQAQAEARLRASDPVTKSGFAIPNLLRRKRRVQARKVRRVVRHIDPWSVLTFSVLFHLSVFAALLLASVLVWNAAEAAGTIENMEAFILDLGDYETFEIKGDVVFRAAVAIAGILTLASSVLLVLLTVVFNLISDLVGGIRLTVIEEETVRVRRKKRS